MVFHLGCQSDLPEPVGQPITASILSGRHGTSASRRRTFWQNGSVPARGVAFCPGICSARYGWVVHRAPFTGSLQPIHIVCRKPEDIGERSILAVHPPSFPDFPLAVPHHLLPRSVPSYWEGGVSPRSMTALGSLAARCPVLEQIQRPAPAWDDRRRAAVLTECLCPVDLSQRGSASMAPSVSVGIGIAFGQLLGYGSIDGYRIAIDSDRITPKQALTRVG